MSKKASRKVSSWRYRLQKAGVRIVAFRVSPTLIAAVVMAFSVFLLGGGIYDVAWKPPAIYPWEGRFLSYIPYRIHEQLLMGSVGVMILYGLGALGLILVYHSTKYVRRPRQLSILSMVGIALLLVAFIAVELTLYWILHFQ